MPRRNTSIFVLSLASERHLLLHDLLFNLSKANELLGRRVALVDVVTAHLLALARAAEPSVRGCVFTICAPFPFSKVGSDPQKESGFLKVVNGHAV